MTKKYLLVAMLVCAPLLADDAQDVIATETARAVESTSTQDPVSTEEPVPTEPEPAEEEAKETPTLEELAARVEALTEALTENRNTTDALSKMKLSGYIQAQYVNDERSLNELTNATTTRNFDQFSIRRGRVKFTYQFLPTAKFVLQPDVTTSGVSLKDGYVEFTEPWTTWKHTLTAGQFNWPFGFEIGYSSSSREVPERSRVIRTLFPGERDRGVMLSGLGLNERFSYRLAVVNGTGTAQSFDFNKRKDIVGRVGYSFGAFDLGGSIYRGEDLIVTSTSPRGREFDKERVGVDFQWATPVPGLGIRGEYVTGKQTPSSGTARAESHDVDGWYLYAIQNIGTRHQIVVRADEYDGDTDVDGNAIRTINPSYIFHWDSHSKVMLSYEFIDAERNDPDDNVFTLRYQYAF
jgi:hypothetical protein